MQSNNISKLSLKSARKRRRERIKLEQSKKKKESTCSPNLTDTNTTRQNGESEGKLHPKSDKNSGDDGRQSQSQSNLQHQRLQIRKLRDPIPIPSFSPTIECSHSESQIIQENKESPNLHKDCVEEREVNNKHIDLNNMAEGKSDIGNQCLVEKVNHSSTASVGHDSTNPMMEDIKCCNNNLMVKDTNDQEKEIYEVIDDKVKKAGGSINNSNAVNLKSKFSVDSEEERRANSSSAVKSEHKKGQHSESSLSIVCLNSSTRDLNSNNEIIDCEDSHIKNPNRTQPPSKTNQSSNEKEQQRNVFDKGSSKSQSASLKGDETSTIKTKKKKNSIIKKGKDKNEIIKQNNNIRCWGSTSPSLHDFDLTNAQILAHEEKKMDRKHTDLLNQATRHSPKPRNIRKNSRSKNNKQQSSYKSKSKTERCILCSTCSCSRSNAALESLQDTAVREDKNPLSCRARSNTEIERTLIGRLGRLEKSASYFNHLCKKVSRELKIHRNKIIKERMKRSCEGEVGDNTAKKKSWFLHDVHEDAVYHEQSLSSSTKFSDAMAKKASTKTTFAFRKSEFMALVNYNEQKKSRDVLSLMFFSFFSHRMSTNFDPNAWR